MKDCYGVKTLICFLIMGWVFSPHNYFQEGLRDDYSIVSIGLQQVDAMLWEATITQLTLIMDTLLNLPYFYYIIMGGLVERPYLSFQRLSINIWDLEEWKCFTNLLQFYYTIMSGLVGYGRYGSGMVGMEAIWTLEAQKLNGFIAQGCR